MLLEKTTRTALIFRKLRIDSRAVHIEDTDTVKKIRIRITQFI